MTFRSALPILLGFLLLSEPATVHAADNTDITANPPFESMASPDTVPIGSPNRAKNLGADRSIRPDRQALRRGLTLPVTEDGVSEGDSDSDGVGDVDDNCPNIPNADQRDADGDGVGDACETEPGTPQPWDRDGDGVGDVDDNCPAVSNPEQADRDRDGTGDACEIEPGVPHPGDADGDGVGDVDDNCPDTPNTEQADHDGDGIGDACAPRPGAPRPGDGDGDGIADHDDNCPEIPNADQRDSDRDGIGDACPLEPSPPPPVIGAETRARIEVLYRNLGAPKPSRDRERRPPPIWTTTLHQPGAEFIKVHFASLNLPEGDSVTVSRPDGRQVHAYPNESSFTTDSDPGFWALSIVGDTAVVTLHSRRGGTEEAARAGQGLTIDKYRHGKAPAVRKAIWGGDDLEDVACYEADFPTEFRRSDAVGRFLLNNGASLCTGWRIQCADTGHVLTNEHCISSQADVSAAELWFNFQAVDCDDFNDIPVIVAGDAFIEDSNSKDFALLTVTDPELIADFGALQVDARKPDKGEEIYIPQHPAGRPKQFGIDSDLDDDDLCRVRKRTSKRAKYKCDTLGGSSGSPVLARSSHRVLALHHQAGWSFNRGVRMDKIWPLIEEHFESCCPTSPADEPAFDGLGYVLQGSVLQNSANTCRLHLGDFNADGRTDLLRSCDNSSYNALIHSTDTGFVGAGYVLTGSVLQNSANTCRVHVGDFDNDDHDDVLRSCNDPSYNALFRGTSTGFVGAGYVLTGSVLQNSANTCRVHVGDYDGDDHDDILRSCDNPSYNALILGTSTGFVGAGYVLTGSVLQNSSNTCRLHVGDYDGDDHDDLLRSCNNPSYNALIHGTGSGFVGAGYVLTGSVLQNSSNSCRVHVGDYDGDDHDDILRSCNDPAYNALFHGTDTSFGGFGYVLTGSVLQNSANTCRLHVGDYDGNGTDDLLRSCDDNCYNAAWRGLTGGGFASHGYDLIGSVLQNSNGTCRLHLGNFDLDDTTDLLRSCDSETFNARWHGLP